MTTYPKPSTTVQVLPSGSSNPNPVVATAACTIRYRMTEPGYSVTATDLPGQLTQIGTGLDGSLAYVDIYDAFTSAGSRGSPVRLCFNLKITHVASGKHLLHDPEIDNERPS